MAPHRTYFGYILATTALLVQVLFAVRPAIGQDTSSSLVAHIKFDENAGVSTSSVVGSTNASLMNGASWVNGRISKAIAFDGVDDHLIVNNLDNNVLAAANLTVCFWFYPRSPALSANSFIFSNTRFVISMITSNPSGYYLQTTNDGGNMASSAYFPANSWYHQCAVRSGSSVSLYINGTLSGTANQNGGAPAFSNFKPTVGQYYPDSGPGSRFYGWIDETRIYSRALTAQDVAKLYSDDNSIPYVDTIPPVISGVTVTPFATSATITWTTDEDTDAQIRYGTGIPYATLSPVVSSLTKSHSITLTGLSSQTTYHFVVRSRDAAGNLVEDSVDRTFTTGAPPGTVTRALSCSHTDVQNAINSASDEGIVEIPAGTCTWPKQMRIKLTEPPRSLTLRGSGCTLDAKGRPLSCATTIRDGVLFCFINQAGEPTTCSTTYQPGMVLGDWYGTLFKITTTRGKYFRLSSLTIQTDPSITNVINPLNPGTADSPNIIKDKNSAIVHIEGDSDAFRIDRIYFDTLAISGRPIFPTGWLTGVIDHNRFGNTAGQAVAMFGYGSGNASWALPHSLGGSNAIFIEDNEFKNLLVTDSWRGARYVIRKNDIETFTIPAQNHGSESGAGVRSGFSMEVYHNRVTVGDGQKLFYLRGGTAVFHNNTIIGPNVSLLGSFVNFRSWDDHPVIGGCYGVGPFDLNDPIIYASGTHTGGEVREAILNQQVVPALLLATGKTWRPNQWVGYSIYNVTKNWGSEIIANSENTVTPKQSVHIGNTRVTPHTWSTNDQFKILRPEICFDQNGRSTGNLISDDTPPYTGDGILPKGWMNQAAEPIYAWGNSINGVSNNRMEASDFITQRHRDYFEGECRPNYSAYTYPHPLVQQQDLVATQNLPLNCPPPVNKVTLTVSKTGTGVGAVTGGPIACGVHCSAALPVGTTITLNAASPPSSFLAGWSGGGCSGTDSCTLTLNSNVTITATFGGSYDNLRPAAPGNIQLGLQ